MPYFFPTQAGLLLLRADAPILVLGVGGFRVLAPLPEHYLVPRCATVFRGHLYVAFKGAILRREGDTWTDWLDDAPETPRALVPVGDTLLLLGADESWGSTQLWRIEEAGKAEPLSIDRATQDLLYAARIGTRPLRDEVLVVGSKGVVALHAEGATALLTHKQRVLDAQRTPDGTLWMLDALDGVYRWRQGEPGTWLRGPRRVLTSTWTDADGEAEEESDEGIFGAFMSLSPLITWTYCADRSLVRYSEGQDARCWLPPAGHGQFLADIACFEGRVWAMRDRGGYALMEAVDEGTPSYRKVALP